MNRIDCNPKKPSYKPRFTPPKEEKAPAPQAKVAPPKVKAQHPQVKAAPRKNSVRTQANSKTSSNIVTSFAILAAIIIAIIGAFVSLGKQGKGSDKALLATAPTAATSSNIESAQKAIAVAELPSNLGQQFIATDYNQESHPEKRDYIQRTEGVVGYVRHNTWIMFEDFHFGQSAQSITIEASSEDVGGVIEVRIDSPQGPIIASIIVGVTGDWDVFKNHQTDLIQTVEGTHDLYFVFKKMNAKGALYLVDVQSFRID